MNKCDTGACKATAEQVAKQLRAAEISAVRVLSSRRYHGRFRVFLDTLRGHAGLHVS